MNTQTLICEIKDTDFEPKYVMGDTRKYQIRTAARGMLINKDKAALLYVKKWGYHKLPGGGIEKGESPEEAFVREIREETGCNCEIDKKLGITIEWKDEWKTLQISYIFTAHVVGTQEKVAFTQGEIDDEFEFGWEPIENVIKILKKDIPKNYEGKFINLRDTNIVNYFLQH